MNIVDAPTGKCDHRTDELPQTTTFKYYDPESVGDRMEFRLIYQGSLPAAGTGSGASRVKEKHLLRKHFHKQLRELWKQHPDLKRQGESFYLKLHGQVHQAFGGGPNTKTWIEHIADDHLRCGGRFVPLISDAGGFTCSLDILFLRRDNPGHLIRHGGDIDNRIKVLFDGLRMPETVQEMGDFAIDPDEDPFFCLLEDDKLVTKVSVTTDRLIIPKRSDEDINDVLLVIHVTAVNPSAIFAGGRLL